MFELEVVDPHFLPHLGCEVGLSLSSGEGIVLLGPNGVGKSTLLKGLVMKYQSSIDLSLVGQGALDFFYDRTVRDVRRLLVLARGEFIDEKVLGELWESLGLHEKEDRYLSALSGGELQSLKLALNLSKRAPLFLLDEPFQSLDQNRKHFLTDWLEDFRKQGKAFLVVEHDLTVFPSGWRAISLTTENGKLVKEKEWTI